MKKVYLIILSIFIIVGCEKIFFKDDPANTPENNFEIFWTDFDRYYAQFNIRNFDWDSVYTLYKPQVSSSISDRQLFDILSEIVITLNDGHVNLFSVYGTVSWKGWGHGAYPSKKLINHYKYFTGGFSKDGVFEYGEFKNYNIGYIIIPTFTGNGDGLYSPDERYLVIDKILEQFKSKDGIIIDIRWNGGGNSVNSDAVAGRFADNKKVYCKLRRKNGVGKNDFSDWIDCYIEPKGEQYTKPVVVLTSRKTFSTAESFVLAMQVLPQVTIVGDTTGGGTGNPIFRELPNSWTYRLSTLYTVTANNLIVDGKGIFPDIVIKTSVEDSINGIDRILEKGIEIIER
ncbi:MAG: S41 family peptidase [Bacteroidales bacterium]|nr:S41 family peptidase [Bacteroidales bacterium]